jgi:hypothetical protein
MLAFDIFRMGHEGNLSWIEMVTTQKDARERVKWYVHRSPAVYFILRQPDGDLEIVEPVGAPVVPNSAGSTICTNS